MYLKPDSNCVQATNLNHGRNVAKVFLDVYNAIPENLVEFRNHFCKVVDEFLTNDVYFVAPEMFGPIVWPTAGHIMSRLFKVHLEEAWARKCRDIFVDNVDPADAPSSQSDPSSQDAPSSQGRTTAYQLWRLEYIQTHGVNPPKGLWAREPAARVVSFQEAADRANKDVPI